MIHLLKILQIQDVKQLSVIEYLLGVNVNINVFVKVKIFSALCIIGLAFIALLTYLYIKERDSNILYGIGFMILWTCVWFLPCCCIDRYRSITIDPLNGILFFRIVYCCFCFETNKYELKNVKTITVKLHEKGDKYNTFKATMTLQENRIIDLLYVSDKNNEKQKLVDFFKNSLPSYVQIEGDLN